MDVESQHVNPQEDEPPTNQATSLGDGYINSHTFDTKVFKKIKIVYTSRVEHTGEEDHNEEVEPKLKIRISEYRY